MASAAAAPETPFLRPDLDPGTRWVYRLDFGGGWAASGDPTLSQITGTALGRALALAYPSASPATRYQPHRSAALVTEGRLVRDGRDRTISAPVCVSLTSTSRLASRGMEIVTLA